MAPIVPRQVTPGKYAFPGVPKQFDYDGAYKFLLNSPKYVAQYASLLAGRNPRLFEQAGYRIENGRLKQKIVAPALAGRFAGPRPNEARWVDRGPAGLTGTRSEKTKPVKPGKPARTPPASAAPPESAPPAVPDAGLGAAPEIDVSGLVGLDPNVGRIIPLALAQRGGRMLDRGTADDIAGLQFDAAIQELMTARAQAPRDTAQQQRDVSSWYDQVLGSQETARRRTAGINQAAVGSVTDATADIVSALGGSANAGSGLVGAAGAEAAGTLAALGSAQEAYDADIRPLLRAESASAKERVQARGSSRMLDLAQRLATARGQRGQAESAAQFEIDKANNATLDQRLGNELAIRQANNQLRQQRYANQFGQEQARIAAGISGAKVLVDAMEAAGGGKKGKSKFYTYAKAPQTTRDDAYNTIVDAILQKPQLTPQQRMILARNILNASYGWSLKNRAVLTLAEAALDKAEEELAG